MVYKIIFFICLFKSIVAYNICIVGAGGALGRELTYQAVQDYKQNILCLTKNPNNYIYTPYRGNGFNDIKQLKPINSSLITINTYLEYNYDYEHIIFCTGAGPFEYDYSYHIFNNFLNNLSPKCKSISILSAYGTGNSLNESNIGIQLMNSYYLKATYKCKNIMEKKLEQYDKDIIKHIYRPKALSYGKTFLPSTSRYDYAKKILNNII